VIMSANNALNHNPPSDYLCYNTFAPVTRAGPIAGADGADAPLILFGFGTNNNEWVTGAGFFIRRRQSWGSGFGWQRTNARAT